MRKTESLLGEFKIFGVKLNANVRAAKLHGNNAGRSSTAERDQLKGIN